MDYKEAHSEIYGMFQNSFNRIFQEEASWDWLYKFAEPHYVDWYTLGIFPSEEEVDQIVVEYGLSLL